MQPGRAVPLDPTLFAGAGGLRAAVGQADERARCGVPQVGLSADLGAVAHRGVRDQQEARGTAVAPGGSQSACAAQTPRTEGRRRQSGGDLEPAGRPAQRHLVLGLRRLQNRGRPGAADPQRRRRIHPPQPGPARRSPHRIDGAHRGARRPLRAPRPAGRDPFGQRSRVHLQPLGRVAGAAGRLPGLHRERQPAAERLRRALQRLDARRETQRRAVPLGPRSPSRSRPMGRGVQHDPPAPRPGDEDTPGVL